MSDIAILEGHEAPFITIPQTQVYLATHDNGGANGASRRLPYRYRSFISFSFDKQWIEDFNFIAFVDGDRMQKNLTADFEDLTSSYDVLDGQFYHSTHFRTNTIHFTLMSDEVDARLMEKFKNHFSPGKTAELILSEYPNRAIQARIAQPPEMAMLPFEKKVELKIAGVTYETSVTNYKGTVDLEFVMDEPFWYSLINIFGQVKIDPETHQHTYVNEWDGSDIYNNPDTLKDVLKIVYEDGIPLYHMIASPMLFGNTVYAASGGSLVSTLYISINEDQYTGHENDPGYHHNNPAYQDTNENAAFEDLSEYWTGGVIQDENNTNDYIRTHGAVIAGAYVTTTENSNLTIYQGKENAVHLYYPGTAPATVLLKFTINIGLDNNNNYVNTIASDRIPFTPKDSEVSYPYNTITFESVNNQDLHITAPNFITSYNKVLDILDEISKTITDKSESENEAVINSIKESHQNAPSDMLKTDWSWEQLRDAIRDEVRHPLIRKYITFIANKWEYNHAITIDTNNQIGQLNLQINDFQLQEIRDEFITIFTTSKPSLSVTLNSKTGEATGVFYYHDPVNDENNINEYLLDSENNGAKLEENVGDMFSSNYLLLRDRNVFDEQMQVSAWTDNHKDYSYRVYHNFPTSLSHVSIEYKNMYY